MRLFQRRYGHTTHCTGAIYQADDDLKACALAINVISGQLVQLADLVKVNVRSPSFLGL